MTEHEAIQYADALIEHDKFDRSIPYHAYKEDAEGWVVRVGCSQCQAVNINGVSCHETGCPNVVTYVECYSCGAEFRRGDSHECEEFDDMHEADPDND